MMPGCREHEYDSYSGKQLVNLEMMEPLEPEELPSTLAMAVSRHRSSRNTTNSTDITIE